MTTDIKTAPLQELYSILRDYGEAKAEAELRIKQVNAELAFRFGNRVVAMLNQKEEPFGRASFEEGDFEIETETPKKVTWDHGKLKGLWDALAQAGDKPEEYIDVEYSISESRFKALPETMRHWFAVARTVEPGKIRITLKAKELAHE